jgi:hypothetical protein
MCPGNPLEYAATLKPFEELDEVNKRVSIIGMGMLCSAVPQSLWPCRVIQVGGTGAADWAYRQRQGSRNLVRISTDAADFRVTRNGMASDRFS